MANHILPPEERHLTPLEVEVLDRRRRAGQLYLVLGFQSLIVAVLVTIWAGQDLTYSPGWAHPMAYWDALAFILAIAFLSIGVRKRRGANEFLSY